MLGSCCKSSFIREALMTFYHPKYYKELRKRNKLDQAISDAEATAASERATGPGPKPQATSRKPQAPSDKHQAPSHKRQA